MGLYKNKDVLHLFDDYFKNNSIKVDQDIKRILSEKIKLVDQLFGQEFRIYRMFKMENLISQPRQTLELLVAKYVGLKRFKQYLAIYGEAHPRECGLCAALHYIYDRILTIFPEAELVEGCGCVKIALKFADQVIELKFYFAIYYKFNYGLSCRKNSITGHFALLVGELYRQLNKALDGNLDRIYRILAFAAPKAPMLYIIWIHYVVNYLTRLIADESSLKSFTKNVYHKVFNGPADIDEVLSHKDQKGQADRLYNVLRGAYDLKLLSSVYHEFFKSPRILMKMTLLGIKEASLTSFHDVYYLFETNVILVNQARSVRMNLGAENSILYNRFNIDAKLVCFPKEAPNMMISFRFFKITQFYDFDEAWMRKAKKIVAFVNKTNALSDQEFFDQFLSGVVDSSGN